MIKISNKSKIFFIIGLSLILFLVKDTSSYEKIKGSFKEIFFKTTVLLGFEVKEIIIKGHNNITSDEIFNLTKLRKGQSIFNTNLEDVRKNVLTNGWIKNAVISRHLPFSIVINITENIPRAIWDNGLSLYLIEENGNIIESIDEKIKEGKYNVLKVISGEEGRFKVVELFRLISSSPELAKTVVSAEYINKRRWDVILKDNLKIKLPQNFPENAWNRFADEKDVKKLINHKVKTIDLRQNDKIIIGLKKRYERDLKKK